MRFSVAEKSSCDSNVLKWDNDELMHLHNRPVVEPKSPRTRSRIGPNCQTSQADRIYRIEIYKGFVYVGKNDDEQKTRLERHPTFR